MLLRHTQFNFKPDSPVQLNKNHPLAKGLVGCWLFNEGGGSLAIDLTGNNNGTFDDFNDRGFDGEGPNVGPFATNDGIQLGSITSSNPLSLFGKTSFSVAFAGVFRTGAVFQRIIEKADGGSAANGWAVLTVDGNVSPADLAFNSNVTSPAPISENFLVDGERFSALWSQSGLSSGTQYKDGRQFDTTSETLNSISSNTTDADIGNRPQDATPWAGEITYVYVYDRALSAKEARDLHENPYQILQPVRRILPTFVDTGAGATGSGVLSSDDATLVGAGFRTAKATGTLSSDDAALVGVGTRPVSGSGTLTSDDAALTGVGERLVDGSGVLASDDATLVGLGTRVVFGTGVLSSDDAVLIGTDAVAPTGGGLGRANLGTANLGGAGLGGSTLAQLMLFASLVWQWQRKNIYGIVVSKGYGHERKTH